MQIQQEESGDKGKFFIELEGKQVAEMTYAKRSPHEMIIVHTEVDDELQGKNIGLELVKKAVDYARAEHIRVVPRCSFAKAVFDKRPDLRDVLEHE